MTKTGYPIVYTGDLMDFITPANLRAAQALVKDTNMMVVAGNHEQAHCVNNVFCPEDYARDPDEIKQIVTGLDTLREITVA